MSDQTWWWCAYLQAVTKWDGHDWPEACPLCHRNVKQELSTHHELLVDMDEVPWGEF